MSFPLTPPSGFQPHYTPVNPYAEAAVQAKRWLAGTFLQITGAGLGALLSPFTLADGDLGDPTSVVVITVLFVVAALVGIAAATQVNRLKREMEAGLEPRTEPAKTLSILAMISSLAGGWLMLAGAVIMLMGMVKTLNRLAEGRTEAEQLAKRSHSQAGHSGPSGHYEAYPRPELDAPSTGQALVPPLQAGLGQAPAQAPTFEQPPRRSGSSPTPGGSGQEASGSSLYLS